MLLSEISNPRFREKVFRLDETTTAGRRLGIFGEAFVKAAGRNKRDKGTWLVIAGPTGIGKSHALQMASQFLAGHAVDFWHEGLWRSIPRTTTAIWSRVVDLPRENWEGWLRDIRESSFVFLDDVGSEVDRFRSGEPMERLRVTLEACDGKWLLLTTNAAPGQWKAALDARSVSRLSRAAVLDLTGAEDYRPRLKGDA